jgi:hypothetical protein
LCFHVVGLELWARIFFRGESPGALSNQLLSLAQGSAHFSADGKPN